MKKHYSTKRGIEKSSIFSRLAEILGAYNVQTTYRGGTTAQLYRQGEKIGYAWSGIDLLIVEIGSSYENVLNWEKVFEGLRRSFDDGDFLESPLSKPTKSEVTPIEVYHHGRRIGVVSTLPIEPGLTPGEIVRLTWLERRFNE